jgi:pimeloyl-ACP methyl ester carboxylesterase
MGGEPIPEGFRHSIKTSVDMAEAELDAAGIGRVHIAGNSLGGWFAIELARRGRALSTVAISPGGGWERGSAEEARLIRTFQQMGRLVRLGGPFASVLGHIGLARRTAPRS